MAADKQDKTWQAAQKVYQALKQAVELGPW